MSRGLSFLWGILVGAVPAFVAGAFLHWVRLWIERRGAITVNVVDVIATFPPANPTDPTRDTLGNPLLVTLNYKMKIANQKRARVQLRDFRLHLVGTPATRTVTTNVWALFLEGRSPKQLEELDIEAESTRVIAARTTFGAANLDLLEQGKVRVTASFWRKRAASSAAITPRLDDRRAATDDSDWS